MALSAPAGTANQPVARQHPPAAASRCKTPMISVIQPQEFNLPNTSCALAVNTCELATAAMP